MVRLASVLGLPLGLCMAADFYGKVLPSEELKDVSTLGRTRAELVGHGVGVNVNPDGSFHIAQLDIGTYLLHVDSPWYLFEDYIVRVTPTETPELAVHGEIAQKGRTIEPNPARLGFKVNETKVFPVYSIGPKLYEPVGMTWNPIKLARENPMMAIFGGLLIFAFGLPKLLEWIDPEVMADVRQKQGEINTKLSASPPPDVANSLSKYMAGVDAKKAQKAPSKR